MKNTHLNFLYLLKIVIPILFLPFSIFSQNKFSSEPAKFIEEVSAMFRISKNQAVTEAGTNFSSTWASFSPTHQKSIIKLTQAMQKSKKFRLSPHYNDLFVILTEVKTKNLSVVQIDSLLYMLDKSIDKLSGSQVQGILNSTRLFLKENYLYKSNYNSLSVSGGTFSFNYMEPAGEIIPAIEMTAENPDSVKAAAPDLDKRKADFFSDWDNQDKVADEWGTINEDTLKNENIMDVGYSAPLQPTIEGPVIIFNKVNLNIKTHYDSTALTETSGSFMLKNHVFAGKGGKYDWSAAGLNPTDVYCDLKEYNFNVKSSKIICEAATLHYSSKTEKAVDGIFEFDSKRHNTPEENLYPRFISFTNNIPVKGLGENIRYTGGFAMEGRKIYSSSIDEGKGMIEILRGDTVCIRSVSNRFELGDSLITSNLSYITLFQGKSDSIYHPGAIFKFNKNQQVLKLYKHPSFRHSPFVDTYHKLEIVADVLTWNFSESKMDFGIINSRDQIPATFESQEYFNGNKYGSMAGLYKFHPLQMIYGYSEKTNSKTFYADDVAKANKLQPATVRGAMIELMKQNFIDYDVKSGLIELKPKAGHYVLSRRNKKDYDNINFVSIEPSGKNATYNLTNNELTVRGVDKLYISDSLNVFFKPDQKEVKILKNRDFMFNGEISTLNFLFKGKNFLFNYDSFLVHLPDIDVIKLSVQQKGKGKDSTFNTKKALGNELTYSAGILYINKPRNKAGRIKYVQYPIFESNTGATVTFNKSNIASGAYDSTMKFKIPPFQLDSLGSADRKAIGFNGDFDSGGIFPSFKERLVIMPDLSLGFIHAIPPEGFNLYDGKGKYYNKITLDNNGLRGDGEIRYLNAVLYSKDFLFLKDCVMTEGTKFINKEGTNPQLSADVKFPDMVVENYRLKWLPKSDKMYISDMKDPIKIYSNTASLQGTANLTSRGMFGEGILLTRGSETESAKFHFEQNKFGADNAIFKIQSDNPKKPAMLCNMVKLDFDFTKGIVNFSPEVEGSASTEFPYAMFKGSLDNGVWDLKKKMVTMKMPEGGDIQKSYFYSTRLDQDSLVFNAKEAIYDVTKLTLNIRGIPFIKVADGKIFPKGNKVFIEENAVIQKLESAKVVLDTIHEFHRLYDGSIEIKSRLRFEGSATYEFINLASDTLAIKFTEFKLNEDLKKNTHFTVATGLIKEEDNFKIGSRIFYKGKIIMHAPKKYLIFDGYVKLDLKGELKNSQWIKYSNLGDTNLVVIDIENATDDNGHPLSSGLHINTENLELYTSFLSEKKSLQDFDVITSKGLLNYNGEKNEFVVGPALKLKDNSKKGNLISYNDSKSILKFEGFFNLLKPNKSLLSKCAGSGEGNLKTNTYSLNALLALSLNLHQNIYGAIGKSFKQVIGSIEDTSNTTVKEAREKSLPYKIHEAEGLPAFEKFNANKAAFSGGLSHVSSGLANSLVFSDINFKWSSQYKSFYSEGPIYISNIGKEDIGKPTKGYIEIQRTSEEDIINIYLEPLDPAWFFFTYHQNRLAITSSNDYVNRTINDKSDGEKISRAKPFMVQAQHSEKSKFVADFQEKYLGIKNVSIDSDTVETEEIPGRKKIFRKEARAKEDNKEEQTAGQEYEINDQPMKPVDKKKAKKYKNNTEFDVQEYDAEEEKKKTQSTSEQQRQSKQDQKKLKELLGN